LSDAFTTTVVDAGGRYGLHPTWKPFSGALKYHMFEADLQEARRLQDKYAHRRDEVTIVGSALAATPGPLTVNIFANRAMSSAAVRNPISALFLEERRPEVDIIETLELEAITIDQYAQEHSLSVDFLKLDTEGTEYDILQGGLNQLRRHVLAVRSEVSFDNIFEGKPQFGTIHELMLAHGFFLLNLDYNGRGDYQNSFVNANGRYGILTACDAVWIRGFPAVFDGAPTPAAAIARVLKVAAFCLLNDASDVAMDILLKARRAANLDLAMAEGSRLHQFVDVGVQKLIYSLKWQPGQSLQYNYNIYREIFNKNAKTVNEFMESLLLNPD
jgi:FkbM family methyltransferase